MSVDLVKIMSGNVIEKLPEEIIDEEKKILNEF